MGNVLHNYMKYVKYECVCGKIMSGALTRQLNQLEFSDCDWDSNVQSVDFQHY